MRRWGSVLLGTLVLGILGLVFWELEYQHMSLVLWLLVAVAVLWSCVYVAVLLRVSPYVRQKRTHALNQRKQRMDSWMVTLGGAGLLAGLGVLFWLPGFETTGQFFWFLVIVVLLWGCVQFSVMLQADRRGRSSRPASGNMPVSGSWAGSKTYIDRFLPGASLQSGTYNEGDEEVWDENKKIPPY